MGSTDRGRCQVMVSTATGCSPLHRTALSPDRLAVGEGRRSSLGGQRPTRNSNCSCHRTLTRNGGGGERWALAAGIKFIKAGVHFREGRGSVNSVSATAATGVYYYCTTQHVNLLEIEPGVTSEGVNLPLCTLPHQNQQHSTFAPPPPHLTR